MFQVGVHLTLLKVEPNFKWKFTWIAVQCWGALISLLTWWLNNKNWIQSRHY